MITFFVPATSELSEDQRFQRANDAYMIGEVIDSLDADAASISRTNPRYNAVQASVDAERAMWEDLRSWLLRTARTGRTTA
jgi:hypothetical protein